MHPYCIRLYETDEVQGIRLCEIRGGAKVNCKAAKQINCIRLYETDEVEIRGGAKKKGEKQMRLRSEVEIRQMRLRNR